MRNPDTCTNPDCYANAAAAAHAWADRESESIGDRIAKSVSDAIDDAVLDALPVSDDDPHAITNY